MLAGLALCALEEKQTDCFKYILGIKDFDPFVEYPDTGKSVCSSFFVNESGVGVISSNPFLIALIKNKKFDPTKTYRPSPYTSSKTSYIRSAIRVNNTSLVRFLIKELRGTFTLKGEKIKETEELGLIDDYDFIIHKAHKFIATSDDKNVRDAWEDLEKTVIKYQNFLK